MMLPSLLTPTLLLLAILNALLVFSIANPDRRIWPPPAQLTWQYYFVWIPTLLSFLLLIVFGIADWNSFNWPALIRWPIGVTLIVDGNLLAWGGVWQFGLKKTSGAKGSLVTTGMYRYSRNPQYVGDICILVGWMILSASVWATPAILSGILAFVLAPFAEEPWLEEIHGDPYREYLKQTPRFMIW
jgi:protein-S-isoprenylcysteine O-methyltransferase Ste14